MTKLIFRSGVYTIGGTIVELINGKDRIIFDFGTVFDPESSDEVLPKVSGIYDQTSEYNDSVVISHIHLDHVKAMNLIPSQTPVYMHSDSIEFLDILKTVGFHGIQGEFRPYTAIDQQMNIGSFTVTPFLVDHDVPGAVAYIFENDDLKLAYTGDIRLHGNHPEYTHAFIEACQKRAINVLISEGVTISFIEDDYQIIPSSDVLETELDFGNRVETLLDKQKPIFFNSYIMAVERLQTMIELGKRLNRKVALSADSALVAKHYLNYDDLYVLENDKFATNYQVVKRSEIDNSWLVQFSYTEKDQMLEFMRGGQLIQTGGEPLGDYDPRFNLLVEELNVNDTDFIFEGLGGHASPENLQYICDSIAPKYTFPLHSFKPQLLKASGSVQIVPEEDLEYVFEKGRLITS